MSAEVPPGAPPQRHATLWRDTDFLKLWCGETISQVGSHVSVLVLPLIAIITLHASPEQVGILTAVQFAPYLLVTLFVGVWLDNHRRRPTLLISNIGRFVLLGLIPLLHFTGTLNIPLLCVIVFLVGTLNALFDVAYLVYLPSLVDSRQLVDANAKLEGVYSVAQVGGPGLGGLLVQAFTAPVAILADAISYAVAALSVATIRKPEPEPPPRAAAESVAGALLSGLRMVFRHPLLRPVTVQAAWFNLFEQAGMTIILIYAVRELRLSPGLIGAIIAVGSIGGLIGAVVAERFGRRVGLGRGLIISIALSSLGLVAVPIASGSLVAVTLILIAGFAVYGLGMATFNVFSLSLRTAACPPVMLARMTAIYRFVAYGTIPLGALLGGLLGGALGLRPALVLVLVALGVAPVVFAFTQIRTVVDLDDCRERYS